MKTFMQKEKEVKRMWYVLDADGRILGRLASTTAALLMGKRKTQFTPHVDGGDGVIVINAAKVRVTGKKLKDKTYQRFSGYPGGRKVFNLETLLSKNPAEVIRHAVKGMLPKNTLGRQMLKRLKVYALAEHKHTAQNPRELKD